jgi:hypothetical protein
MDKIREVVAILLNHKYLLSHSGRIRIGSKFNIESAPVQCG